LGSSSCGLFYSIVLALVVGTEKNFEKPQLGEAVPGWDSNWVPPECDTSPQSEQYDKDIWTFIIPTDREKY
jgi:hypothetical protein